MLITSLTFSYMKWTHIPLRPTCVKLALRLCENEK